MVNVSDICYLLPEVVTSLGKICFTEIDKIFKITIVLKDKIIKKILYLDYYSGCHYVIFENNIKGSKYKPYELG